MIVWFLITVLIAVATGYICWHAGYMRGAEDHCDHEWERTQSGKSFYCPKCGKLCLEMYDE